MIPPDLHSQMLRMLDGELSAGELAALEAELETNPEARKAWQRLSRLHSALEVRFASQANVEKLPIVPIDRVLARQRRRVVRISMLAAAAVVLVSAVVLWINTVPGSTVPPLAGFQPAPNSVFTLSHSEDAESPVGNVLTAGSRVVLEHGVMELALPHQVIALIEAPAAITLIDARTLQLDHGRAFFRVDSAEGRGFTVATPHQRIVDLGTAFGIDTRPDRSEVELHVFEGRVRIDDLDGAQRGIINATRAVLLAGAQMQHELDRPTTFRRKLPAKVETLLLEDFESGLVGGRDYAVRIDPTAIRDLAGNRFAGISDDETWNFTTASPATVPVPVASYVYDGANPPTDQPSDHQPSDHTPGLFLDPGNTKLTDGNPGDPIGWTSGTYVGFKDEADISNPQVTFDLGSVHEVQTIMITAHTMTSDRPEAVNVSISTDGIDYATPLKLVPEISGSGPVTATLDLSSSGPARYYRLNFVNPTDWTFLGEVEFAAAAAASRGDEPRNLTLRGGAPETSEELSNHDDSPPQLTALRPADDDASAEPGGGLAMVFNEPVKFGTGRIILRNLNDWSEREIAVGGPRTSIDGRVVHITPPSDLGDGERNLGPISGWKSSGTAGALNPRGDGTCYRNEALADRGRGHGTIGAMRGPIMATFKPGRPGAGIRRQFATIAPSSRYTVSAAIGVRNDKASFLGYTIRLRSGDTILAELSSDIPPGPPNSVTTVGFSWDSSALPDGVAPAAPLDIEIVPNQAAGLEPGYLDLDHVRVTVVGE